MENSKRVLIEELAELQFSDGEICKLADIEINAEIAEIISISRLKSEHQIRKILFDMAKNGNPYAQKQFAELIEKRQKSKILKR